MKSIFQYTNYRTYLADYYKDRKEREGYTYRKFAEKVGVNSSSWLLLLIKGKKNLSTDSAVRVSKALGHSDHETEYFENLVKFTQAKDIDSKNYFFRKIAEIKKRLSNRKKLDIQLLTQDQFEYYSTWYHPVIKSLVTKLDFGEDWELLAAQLIPRITASKARKSVLLLKRLGLIRQREDGSWEQAGSVLSTGDEVESLSVVNYHRQTARMGEKVFENCSRDERDMSSLTMGISEKEFRLIKASVQSFRKEVMKIAQHADDDASDRVYQMNIQLFPMAIINREKE